MRRIVQALVAVACLASPVSAEEVKLLPEIVIGNDARNEPARPGGAAVSPGIVIGGGAAGAPSGTERCGEAAPGKSMACLNQQLKREVDRVNPVMNLPPIDARSPDIRTGVVNIPAVQQQYGRNFGVSAFPYRPAPPVFTVPRR
jgi:hypothetical protein